MHPRLILPNSLRVYHSSRGLVNSMGPHTFAFGGLCGWLMSVGISHHDGESRLSNRAVIYTYYSRRRAEESSGPAALGTKLVVCARRNGNEIGNHEAFQGVVCR